jgi:tRNA (cmo5U34)-methyltransferase
MFMEYWDAFLKTGALSNAECEEVRRRWEMSDRNVSLTSQLLWLQSAGFSDVDLIYRNRMFVVLTGRRPQVSSGTIVRCEAGHRLLR